MSLSDELCRSYLDLRWHFDPAEATQAGVTGGGHDGRLGRFDDAAVREHLAASRAIEAAVEEQEVEDAADELDRTALLDDLRVAIFRLQHECPHRRNPAFWLLHLCEALHGLLPHEAGRVPDPAPVLARLRAIPEFLRSAEATLREPPAELIDTARALVDPASSLIGELVLRAGSAHSDSVPLVEAAAAAEAALAGFHLLLDRDPVGAEKEHSPAVGAEQFDRLLHHLHAVRAGASELWRYVLHFEEETVARLAELDPDWRAVLDRMVEQRGEDDQNRIGTAAAELERLRRFAERAGHIPAETTIPDVAPMPVHLHPVTGHARYQAGSLDDPLRHARLYLAPWRSTRAWLPVVVAESGVPGQHLRGARAARLRPEIRRHLSSRMIRGGWGLYMVELVEEAGYWADPRDRLLARAHLLLRVLLARIDIGIHTRQLRPAEAVDLLVERLPLERGHAVAMMRDCCLEPSRATGTILGRRELLRLRGERRRALGSSFSDLTHHEEVLSYGTLPVPLIRWGMGLEE